MANPAAADSKTNGRNGADESGPSFSSKLQHGRQRFLAHAIEHALEVGRRTPEDFIRHFPPRAIMEGLSNRPSIRAELLVHTTGIKKKIAAKKSWESAGEDLQIALDEGETNADTIVSVFDADDRVRYLDEKKIWAFVIEGAFWTATPSKKDEYRIAKRHMAFLLDRALTDQLITHRDVVEGISVNEMATRLPKAELGKIIERALHCGHDRTPFSEVELLAAMPPDVLVEYVPLTHIFEAVVEPKIAQAHNYVAPAQAETEAATAKPALDLEAAATAAPIEQAPRRLENPQQWMDEMADEPVEGMVDEDEISDDDFAPA